MDPEATLLLLIEAIKEQDRDGYEEALDCLRSWHRNGGFMPRASVIEAIPRPEMTMIDHLKGAVSKGYGIANPGGLKEVRDLFPLAFCSKDQASHVRTSDDLEVDDHPLISTAEGGYWVSSWSWVPQPND